MIFNSSGNGYLGIFDEKLWWKKALLRKRFKCNPLSTHGYVGQLMRKLTLLIGCIREILMKFSTTTKKLIKIF